MFFGTNGLKGVIGIIFSAFIIGIIIYKTLKIVLKFNIETYDDFLNCIINSKNMFLKKFLRNIVNIFLLITFYIMVAAFSAYLFQEFKISNILGTIIAGTLCYIIFSKNIKNVVNISTILIPILIFFILILSAKNITFTNYKYGIEHMHVKNNIIINTILYSSYNSILLIPVLVTFRNYLKSRKQLCIIMVTNIIIIAIISILILLMISQIHNLEIVEIPIIEIANNSGILYRILGGIFMIIAILTSILSAGYAILSNFIKTPKIYKIVNILMCTSAILISNIGFSKLINILYPIFGFLGIIQIIMIIKKKT